MIAAANREDDRFFIEQAFKTDSANTQVHSAGGGQQAFEHLSLARSLPDVILLDLNMPGMTGFEVLAHLKQSTHYQSIPIVILTTTDSVTDQEQARQLGAAEFITKPTTSLGLSAIAEQIRLGILA